MDELYHARLGFVNFDSARHTGSPPMHHRKGCESQIEAKRSDQRGPAPSGQDEEAAETREGPVDLQSAEQVKRLWREPARRDRFGEVAASQNSQNLTARGTFSCQTALPEIGPTGQLRLQNSSILVAGLGGLGCAALPYLAASGIGRIGLLDFDRVEASNLPRQILYGKGDVGKRKAEASFSRLQGQYPDVSFERHEASIKHADVEPYDLILDATDNAAARYAINDLGKPWIYGSIDRWEGQAAFFAPNFPDYRFLFPDASGFSAPRCSTRGLLGPMAGVIGSIQALEAMKYLATGMSDLQGKLLVLDARLWRTRIFRLCNPSPLEVRAEDLSSLGPICLVDASFPVASEDLPKERKIIFYCLSGTRSRIAAERFRQEGFDAYFFIKE